MTQSPQILQTIEMHILELQKLHPAASGNFTNLLNDITFAAKIVSREVTKAGLVDILGATGESNVQGETVQKLDDYANAVFLKCLGTRGQVCIMGSEEMADPVFNETGPGSHNYVVVFDPLDGSSNIDANVSVGTIFGIWKRRSLLNRIGPTDLLQPGRQLVAAGYVIYGSSTMFVYTAGHGVHGFTLDPSIGEFLLSHENITTPFEGGIYSVNEGNEPKWTAEVRETVRQLKYGREWKARRPARSGQDGALHRFAGRRLPPQPALRRRLPLSAHGRQARRQAAPDVRGGAPGPGRRKRRRLREQRVRADPGRHARAAASGSRCTSAAGATSCGSRR